jgi:transcriptional regulator with XRE-family HTH domain
MTITPRAARVNKGLTQVEIAQLMGVSVGTVQRLEADIRRARADHIMRFAEITGTDPNDLLLPSAPSLTGAER